MIETGFQEEIVQHATNMEISSQQSSEVDLAQQLIASMDVVTSSLPKTTKKGRKQKSGFKTATMR